MLGVTGLRQAGAKLALSGTDCKCPFFEADNHSSSCFNLKHWMQQPSPMLRWFTKPAYLQGAAGDIQAAIRLGSKATDTCPTASRPVAVTPSCCSHLVALPVPGPHAVLTGRQLAKSPGPAYMMPYQL